MTIPNETTYIGVIGGSSVDDEIKGLARETGKLIAQSGAVVVCGGLGGVMTAVCKGAKEYNGETIGILPGQVTSDANDFVDYPIATGIGRARNMVIINTADVLIAIDGSYGTLSEIALALNSDKKVIAINSKWANIDGVIIANSPKEAVNMAVSIAKRCK